VVTAAALAGASLAGLWAGYQPPFPPADDDSRLSVWHLITSPAASIVTVTATSMLLGDGGFSSLGAAALGAGAGAGAALLASSYSGDGTVVITYAGVHGLVTALLTR
jgi:hypothetical protein